MPHKINVFMPHSPIMGNAKQFYLDTDAEQILAALPQKKQSAFVRDAIKFYNYNKNKKFNQEPIEGEIIRIA